MSEPQPEVVLTDGEGNPVVLLPEQEMYPPPAPPPPAPED